VKGLKAFPKAERPPVAIVFWAFRIMVGLGVLMIALGLWGAWLAWRKKGPETSRTYLRACVVMGPTGFIAVIAGWVVAEVGRQPWVIYGLMRTADAVSPVAPGSVSSSLIGFLIVYAIVFAAGALYILRLFDEGPAAGAGESEPPEPRAPGSPLAKAPNDPEAAT
jgi:cytochrome d ubiquinol oxidase subunit I